MSTEYFSDYPIGLSGAVVMVAPDYNKGLLNGDYFGFGLPVATTQKARGIFYLQEVGIKIASNYEDWKVPRHLLFTAGTQFDQSSFNYPVFARPCPTVPRHGFVDSIICQDSESLNALSRTTFEVESDAELLITKPIDCHYNVIINGGVITFAAGNDGATGGKGCQYFHIAEDPIAKLIDLSSHSIIAEGEVPFYELVLGKDGCESRTCLVQVRSAPHTPKVKDFVPAPVQVKLIIKAEGDLLAWEKLLKEVDPATTIVDHVGGSLSSHYAIHAIINKVAIFTSYVPDLESFIEPTVEDTEINEQDKEKFYQAFSRGFSSVGDIVSSLKYASDHYDMSAPMRDILILSLATLHNFSSIAMSKDYDIMGMVLGLFCRVAFAVSAGETRYAYKISGALNKFDSYFKTLPHSAGRTPCYQHMMVRDAVDCANDAAIMYQIFNSLGWGSNFGGKKWARCTKSAIDLYNACVNKEITEVVELFNKVINEEHNGGKYLNKVINVNLFDKVAKDPSKFTLVNLRTIVDLLHTSWRVSKPSADLKIIELKEVAKAISGKVSILDSVHKSVFLKPTISGLYTSIALKQEGTMKNISLPKTVYDSSGECHCESCVGDSFMNLHSKPFWWVTKDGTKIISKSALNKLISKETGVTDSGDITASNEELVTPTPTPTPMSIPIPVTSSFVSKPVYFYNDKMPENTLYNFKAKDDDFITTYNKFLDTKYSDSKIPLKYPKSFKVDYPKSNKDLNNFSGGGGGGSVSNDWISDLFAGQFITGQEAQELKPKDEESSSAQNLKEEM